MTNRKTQSVPGELDRALLEDLLLKPHGPLAGLAVLERIDSTNTYLVEAYRADPAMVLPVVAVAEHQTHGKGRVGRTWQTPAHSALTASLIAPMAAPPSQRSWIPLLAGLAVVRALRSTLGVAAVSKWPNDILVNTDQPELPGWLTLRKLGGLLVEMVDQDTVVIGVGLNVDLAAADLPVQTATSLRLIGCLNLDRSMLLASFAQSFAQIFGTWQEHGWDIVQSGLREELLAISGTVGATVRVELAQSRTLVGEAVGLAPDGGLEVRDEQGETHTVYSGDVYHLRLH